MVESVVAIMIVSIGLMGLLSMQPNALKTTSKTDHLGRAAMILGEELANKELELMNPCNSITTGTAAPRVVNTSGQATATEGDLPMTVTTTTTLVATNVWRVTVQVSWPPLNATGIKESIVVTRQANFRFGCT